jgi:hypothetical protein
MINADDVVGGLGRCPQLADRVSDATAEHAQTSEHAHS